MATVASRDPSEWLGASVAPRRAGSRESSRKFRGKALSFSPWIERRGRPFSSRALEPTRAPLPDCLCPAARQPSANAGKQSARIGSVRPILVRDGPRRGHGLETSVSDAPADVYIVPAKERARNIPTQGFPSH